MNVSIFNPCNNIQTTQGAEETVDTYVANSPRRRLLRERELTLAGLGNVRQRRQRRCQEIFHKITRRKYFCISQEIILFIINFPFCFDTSKNTVKVTFPVI